MRQLLRIARCTKALVIKETTQMIRDRTVIVLGIVIPIVLILLFGYGMSFDVKGVKLGIVDGTKTAMSTAVVQEFKHNELFVTRGFNSEIEGREALRKFEVEALLLLRQQNAQPEIQILVDGTDAPRALAVKTAIQGSVTVTMERLGLQQNRLDLVPRMWFNESSESRWYLVPGLFAMILSLTGIMLTSLVVAKEWENGTMESIIVTPEPRIAFFLSKLIPYFILAMVGWLVCLFLALTLFQIPLRGSVFFLLLSTVLYLVGCLGFGLAISSITKSQFLSCQISLLVGFLPAIILSGFVFDLRNVPEWAYYLSMSMPPAYYLESIKICFLTGGMEPILVRDCLVLLAFAMIMLLIAFCANPKIVRKKERCCLPKPRKGELNG